MIQKEDLHLDCSWGDHCVQCCQSHHCLILLILLIMQDWRWCSDVVWLSPLYNYVHEYYSMKSLWSDFICLYIICRGTLPHSTYYKSFFCFILKFNRVHLQNVFWIFILKFTNLFLNGLSLDLNTDNDRSESLLSSLMTSSTISRPVTTSVANTDQERSPLITLSLHLKHHKCYQQQTSPASPSSDAGHCWSRDCVHSTMSQSGLLWDNSKFAIFSPKSILVLI